MDSSSMSTSHCIRCRASSTCLQWSGRNNLFSASSPRLRRALDPLPIIPICFATLTPALLHDPCFLTCSSNCGPMISPSGCLPLPSLEIQMDQPWCFQRKGLCSHGQDRRRLKTQEPTWTSHPSAKVSKTIVFLQVLSEKSQGGVFVVFGLRGAKLMASG
jgi:hypothetical protein